MRRAALVALLSLGLTRCFDEPRYEGLACSIEAPCPKGFVCNESSVCERVCRHDIECPVGAVCRDERCEIPVPDAGPSDAGGAACETVADCVAPGPCELADDRVDCAEGECRYPRRVCDRPPAGECLENDTRYRSYADLGECDASGECVYAEVTVDCIDCAAFCLLRCESIACTESNGGCRTGGRCVPDDPPRCEYVSATDATPCDLAAAADGICFAGECVECFEASHCEDGNPCTADSCAANSCVHAPISTSCDDGDACTTVDLCDDGTCIGTSLVACDVAPGACYVAPGSCDPTDGACIFDTAPLGTACDDQNLCTTEDACVDGDCLRGSQLDCDDQNPCTDDSCDPAIGCVNTDNGSACDDGDACTVNDLCTGPTCEPGTALDCNDGNPCTADSCDPASGCARTNLPDGDACRLASGALGVCAAGACAGCNVAADCNDGNPCTTDACVSGTCQLAPNTNSCNDADACTHGDTCSNTTCRGTRITCNSTACITRSCNGTATCSQTIHDGRNCTDDGNACTTDVCNANGSCTHPSRNNGASCGASSANRCCSGSCVNVSTNESHCGGCGSSCDNGNNCESVASTTNCNPSPANVSGRCRCQGSNAQCPRGQLCRTVSPYTNRCSPSGGGSECAPGQSFVGVNSCPDYCRY